jgi:putative transposase
MRADPVESALAMVVAMRGELAEKVIVDPDRGCTPARSWRGSPARHDLTRSAGRIGVCWETLPPNHSGATLKVAPYDRYLWHHPHRP